MSTKLASFLSSTGAVLNGIGVGYYNSRLLLSGCLIWIISNILWMYYSRNNRDQFVTFAVFFMAAVYGAVIFIIRGV